MIRAKIKFQRISKVGISDPQVLEFNIPVQIVDQDAKVTKDRRYYEDVPIGEKILIIVLWPIIFPWALHGGS